SRWRISSEALATGGDGMSIEWQDASAANGGAPAFICEIGADRDADTWPGVAVYYGQGPRGTWSVLIELAGEYMRRSDMFETQDEAREVAEGLVVALRRLWP